MSDMSKESRQMIHDLRGSLLRSLMVGPVRALDLIVRMRSEFSARGWPNDEDARAVVACAVGAVKLGAGDQIFRLPPALLSQDAWFALAANSEGARMTADQIVEGMELQRLLEPA